MQPALPSAKTPLVLLPAAAPELEKLLDAATPLAVDVQHA